MRKFALIAAMLSVMALTAGESHARGTRARTAPRSYSTRSHSTGGYYRGPRQPAGHYAGGTGGSSHKGGHYTNSRTGNHYQKRGH